MWLIAYLVAWIGLWGGVVPATVQAQESCPSATEGNSYTRRKTEKNKELYWASRYVEMEVYYSSAPSSISREDFTRATKESQTTWENIGCTNFEFGDQLGDAPSSATNLINSGFNGSRCESQFDISTNQADCVNRIVFRTNRTDPDDPMYWPQDPSDEHWVGNCTQADCKGNSPTRTLALTTTLFNEATGRIIDADMDINAANWHWTMDPSEVVLDDTLLLQSVMTHEFGHVLGFGHICNTVDSIMNPEYTGLTTLNEENDENGMCAVYPRYSITPGSGDIILSGIEGGCAVSGLWHSGLSWIWGVFAVLCWRRRKQ